MKILHTADWHLGNVFHGHSRLAEHRHFLSALLDVINERQPDALLVTGDVFDSPNPPASAEELLYDFLLRATTLAPGLQVVLTAGNHDSAGRIEAPAALLKTHNVYVRGVIHYTPEGVPDYDYYLLPLASRRTGRAECLCAALPFLRGNDYPAGLTPEQGHAFFFEQMERARRKNEFRHLPLIVAAHFYAAGADVCKAEHSERLVVGGQDCVSSEVVPESAAYVALGHIHKAQQVRGHRAAYYAGSPVPLSFSEARYKRSFQWIELDEDGRAEVSAIPYTPLRSLQVIPAEGDGADAAQALAEIERLPKRQKGDDGSAWNYLEIRIRERQPEPTLLHDVTEALADRAVHFCRMVRLSSTAAAGAAPQAGTPAQALAPDALEPLKMARAYFLRRYSEDMPQTLIDRFKKAQASLHEAQ